MKNKIWSSLVVVAVIAMSMPEYSTAQPLSDESNLLGPNSNGIGAGTQSVHVPVTSSISPSELSDSVKNIGFYIVPLAGLSDNLWSPKFRYGGIIGYAGSRWGRVFAEYTGDGIRINNVLVGYEYPLKSSGSNYLVPSIAFGYVTAGYRIARYYARVYDGEYPNSGPEFETATALGISIGLSLEFGVTESVAWRLNFQTMFGLGKEAYDDGRPSWIFSHRDTKADNSNISAGIVVKL